MPQPDWRQQWHDLHRHHLRAEWPIPAADETVLAQRLALLRARGLDRLPLPAHGETLTRWAVLADIAGLDLSLLKLFEGHTDALAILAELSDRSRFPAEACWAVWAAELPTARLELTTEESSLLDGQRVRLNGRKAWCSGATTVTHALVTAWHRQTPCLAAVEMNANGVGITSDGWSAVGMAITRSVEVTFDDVPATLVGGAGSYLQRPGFWHGGIGIAACWWGAAARLGDILRKSLDRAPRPDDPHAFAHLGAVDVALRHGQARLHETAHWIDAHPEAETRHLALSVRAAIDHGVAEVIHHVGRGVGAGPYCRDPLFARLMADLPVFVRQCHAERDLEAIGKYVVSEDPSQDHAGVSTWSLWS